MSNVSRRKLIRTGLAGVAGVSGIAFATRAAAERGLIPPDYAGLYGCGHTLTYAAQRLLTGNANARVFSRDQISKTPHPNGGPPKTAEFARLQAGGFKDWRVQIGGMVRQPASLSLADLKNYPARSHITQLICEEGWSYIAEWTGVPLSHVLNQAGVLPQARYVVVHAMDGWVDAIDMNEAWHEQTLLNYAFNGGDLPLGHGGPLRLRVPRQLGYKSMKFLTRVSLTDTLKGVVENGEYSWFAGI